MSIGSEVNKDLKAAQELLELCADAALDGVSLVAVVVDTGEVVAVAFNKLQVSFNDCYWFGIHNLRDLNGPTKVL